MPQKKGTPQKNSRKSALKSAFPKKVPILRAQKSAKKGEPTKKSC